MSGPKRADVEAALNTAARSAHEAASMIAKSDRAAVDSMQSKLAVLLREATNCVATCATSTRDWGPRRTDARRPRRRGGPSRRRRRRSTAVVTAPPPTGREQPRRRLRGGDGEARTLGGPSRVRQGGAGAPAGRRPLPAKSDGVGRRRAEALRRSRSAGEAGRCTAVRLEEARGRVAGARAAQRRARPPRTRAGPCGGTGGGGSGPCRRRGGADRRGEGADRHGRRGGRAHLRRVARSRRRRQVRPGRTTRARGDRFAGVLGARRRTPG